MNTKENNKNKNINNDSFIINKDFIIDENIIINDNINKIKDKKDIDNITINDIHNI